MIKLVILFFVLAAILTIALVYDKAEKFRMMYPRGYFGRLNSAIRGLKYSDDEYAGWKQRRAPGQASDDE